MKGFVYLTAGTYKNKNLGIQPWLNVQEMTEQKLLLELQSHGWLDHHVNDYKHFIEKAEIGEMFVMKDSQGEPMVAIVRLRPQPDWV